MPHVLRKRGLGLLVLALVVVGVAFLLASYLIAVLNHHVYAALPYIRCDDADFIA